MSEAKHTPLPWFAGLASVRGVGNEFVADCDDHTPYHLSPTCTANAALIVRAVNAHADLLAACERAEMALLGFVHRNEAIDGTLADLRAAIARGKGAA